MHETQRSASPAAAAALPPLSLWEGNWTNGLEKSQIITSHSNGFFPALELRRSLRHSFLTVMDANYCTDDPPIHPDQVSFSCKLLESTEIHAERRSFISL